MTASSTLSPEWLHWPQTRTLIHAFDAKPGRLRFVGGAVRDSLIGHTVQDVDAATSLLPQEVLSLLEAASIKAIPTGLPHGTVTAVIDGKHFEITTLRKDVSCDGRHADVAYTDSWEEDARRRDFTMNALYLSPSGELFDYVGGVDDAKTGHVRFIGDAAHRIE
jgi:poly(A) polymerase